MLATATWAPGTRDDRVILRQARDKITEQAGSAFAEQGILLGDGGSFVFPAQCAHDAPVTLALEQAEITAIRKAIGLYFWPTLPRRFEDELLALDGWLKVLSDQASVTDALKRVPREQRQRALANVDAEEAMVANPKKEEA